MLRSSGVRLLDDGRRVGISSVGLHAPLSSGGRDCNSVGTVLDEDADDDATSAELAPLRDGTVEDESG